MIAAGFLSGVCVFDLGVVGNWSWRGCEPFGFGIVELICFDYRPAVVTCLVRQTPAAVFLTGRAALYTPQQGHVKARRYTQVLQRQTIPSNAAHYFRAAFVTSLTGLKRYSLMFLAQHKCRLSANQQKGRSDRWHRTPAPRFAGSEADAPWSRCAPR